jgi:hypothetical protein
MRGNRGSRGGWDNGNQGCLVTIFAMVSPFVFGILYYFLKS